MSGGAGVGGGRAAESVRSGSGSGVRLEGPLEEGVVAERGERESAEGQCEERMNLRQSLWGITEDSI